MNEDDASSIKITKALLQDDSVKADLVFIKTHLSIIPETIKKLESRNTQLINSLKLFDTTINSILTIEGSIGDVIWQKCEKVVKANVDLPDLRKIASLLGGDPEEHSINMSPQQICSFKFAPITSTEVERTFSSYKNILSDRRHNLTQENLTKL